MCGIVGILSNQPVAHHLMDALRHLEYRGYDSAGIATMENGVLARRRAAGKLKNLEELVEKEPLAGTIGIGHSRWATHGKPSLENAHPHMTQNVAVVHNGIIENYKELRESLLGDGINFESETDTEVIAHLVTKALRGGKPPKQAVSETLKKLRGAFALAFLFDGEEDLIICARQGSPLAIGHGDGSMYLGSDALALTDFTNDVTYLEEGDWAVLHRSGVEIFDRSDKPVQRSQTRVPVEGSVVEKGPFKHFMLKEIHEQQEVISHTLAHYIDLASETIKLPELPFDFAKLSRLSLSACGTAYFAALASRYWFERAARLPVDIDIASEFRYREAPLDADG
ncbi:MAG: isomerizing glutamine--fructose-6-phosphate transaminase, partial [Pseudomonadota bacterium]